MAKSKSDPLVEKNFSNEKASSKKEDNIPMAPKRHEIDGGQSNKPNPYPGKNPTRPAGSFYRDTNEQIDKENNYPDESNLDQSPPQSITISKNQSRND